MEYMHIENYTIRRWLRDRIEEGRLHKDILSNAEKKRVLNHLLEGELFEKFLHTRYVGQKRFSLEGGETIIPMLDKIVEECRATASSRSSWAWPTAAPQRPGQHPRQGLRVRLQRVRRKLRPRLPARRWRREVPPRLRGGRHHQQRHQGRHQPRRPTRAISKRVDPVVEGKTRAWQRKLNDTAERRKVIPILLHGDASFSGQGVVAETLNLSSSRVIAPAAPSTSSSTTRSASPTSPVDGSSSQYCTSVAKMLGSPIFHVNGDDPMAAVTTIQLAFEFRQQFQRDVVVDMYCYPPPGPQRGRRTPVHPAAHVFRHRGSPAHQRYFLRATSSNLAISPPMKSAPSVPSSRKSSTTPCKSRRPPPRPSFRP